MLVWNGFCFSDWFYYAFATIQGKPLGFIPKGSIPDGKTRVLSLSSEIAFISSAKPYQ
jgi:hypothetical protein